HRLPTSRSPTPSLPSLPHPLSLPSYATLLPFLFFFLMIRPPPRSPLFPYTTLFRSCRPPVGTISVLSPVAPRRVDLARHGEIDRSEEHTSELQSLTNLVCRLLLEKKKICWTCGDDWCTGSGDRCYACRLRRSSRESV